MNASDSRDVRVRFAPSPTGQLHIGSLRAALFNYLFARHHNGTFLLRIEDTDKERSQKEHVDSIMDALSWVNLLPDETPIIQSDREKEHKRIIAQLLKEGKAYRCYCTDEQRKERAEDTAFMQYDGTCRDRTGQPDVPFVVRFKIPKDITEIVFEDMIRGTVRFDRDQLEDFIIARSDETPVYNFVVVVDDAFMQITDIIRGEDHIANTPKQILIYQACGYDVPRFAHVPLILGPSGDRLSKRDGATSAFAYKKMGYLSDALINYLVRLGWAHGDQEIFSREELIEFFTLKAVGKKGSIFDIEKLNWVNSVYIKQSSPEELLSYIEIELDTEFIDQCGGWDRKKVIVAITLYQDRVQTLQELIDAVLLLASGSITYSDPDMHELKKADTKKIIDGLLQVIEAEKVETADVYKAALKAYSKEHSVPFKVIGQLMRVALLGSNSGPALFALLALVGHERVVHALEVLQEKF